MYKETLYRILIFIFLLYPNYSFGWGITGHKEINRHAVFTLPYPLFQFYKSYLGYITEHSLDPDKRRYVDSAESVKHFIDLDTYIKVKNSTVNDICQAFFSSENFSCKYS